MTPTDKHIVINSWVDNQGIRQFVWHEVTHLNDGVLQGRSIELANGRLATCLTVEGDKLIISNDETLSERELQKSRLLKLELLEFWKKGNYIDDSHK